MSLFPPRIEAKWSLSGPATATDPFGATCDDGLDYVVKKYDGGWPVRAAEYLSSRIAEEVGVPTPPFRILEDTDGERVFGSQVLENTLSSRTAMLSPAAPNTHCLRQTSRIAALDLLLGNEDRHLNNYLVRSQNLEPRVIAMDFSHALFRTWPPPPLPFQPLSNTVKRGRVLRSAWGFDLTAAQECTMRFARLPRDFADQLVKQIPSSWMPPALQSEFVRWWGYGAKTRRAREVMIGLRDGSLL